ncbi:MAG: hypothetical protein OER95_12395, partial [Acidimicrobiia bacterium]|nr:hypothetical protein [Acidimicrobiia bacterium]
MFDLLLAVSQTALALVPESRFTGAPDLDVLPTAVADELAAGTDDIEALTIVAELLGDSELKAILARRHPPGEAIQALLDLMRTAEVYDAFEIVEPWDEHRSYGIAVRLVNGEEFSALVEVDVFGSLTLADGFAGPVPASVVRRQIGSSPDLRISGAGHSEIHRALEDAIESAHRSLPPVMTDSWPSHSLLVEWVVRLLPEPAAPSDWEPMSDEAQKVFIDAFLASDDRSSLVLDDEDIESMLSSLLWFKDGYTNGDVHRWGPNQIGYLLGDWALRKLMIPDDELKAIPSILRALIPWCHRQTDGFEQRHTEEVVAAIDHFEIDFLAGLRPDRRKGVDALMDFAAPYLGLDDAAAGFTGDLDVDYARLEAKWRAAAVGGEDVLASLSVESLPAD